MKSSAPIKVGLISLGCAKNLVDSEVMVGVLLRDGMELTPDVSDADVVIINTCGFIEAAKKESIDAVLKANELRHTGRCRALIVAGCLAQRYPKDLQRDLLEVDALVGLNEVPQIAQIIRQTLERSDQPQTGHHGHDATATLHWSGPARFVPDFATPRYRLTPKHWAYVKIGEGCNHPCTFCCIPRIRGKYRSRSLADVVAEVRAFVADGACGAAGGVREINLISQDTTFYGRDLPGKQGLPELLRAIQQVDGDFWVRLLYTHPAHWSDDLIDAVRESPKVCRYVDMPLQHINDAVLSRMRRETDGKYIRDLVARLRDRIPGLALRSTFIVGFPGETEAQFNELLDFLREARFERVGVFAYSQEDHTPAGTMADQLPAKVKRDRHRRAMTVQQQVSRDVLRGFVGRTLRVLVEKPAGRGWLARSHADAPEIDGTVKVRGAAQPGEFANVRITGATAYDLRGEIIRSC